MIDNIEQALKAAADAAQVELGTKNHDAIWHYDRIVNTALASFLPSNKQELRDFYVGVQTLAYKSDPNRGSPWTGYTIVANSLSSKIAWLTPGFAEARTYHNIYGS